MCCAYPYKTKNPHNQFYIGTNLHVLCIPIQNQESAQSNMIYSCGLRSIIDLKEGRKTTWCTISFSSKPAWSLQPKKHRQLAHDHSAILSLFCSGRLSSSVHSNWLGQFSWWRLTQTVHLPTDGFSWMRIDRTHCTSKTGRFKDRETETQNFTFIICTLYWHRRIHLRRLARTADWTGARSQCAVTGRIQACSPPWLCRASVVLTVTLQNSSELFRHVFLNVTS
jgi:hypothetical protein